LRVGAVEHRDVGRLGVSGVREPVDLVGHELRLVALVVAHVADDLLAVALGRPEVLVLAALVATDDGVGGGEDVLGRAVVLLQQDRGRVREVVLELQDVADAGPAEGVDGLVGVAHHHEIGFVVAELADERVLSVVGVLVLVDEHVPEPAAVRLADIGERLEQVDGHHDEVVEVHGVGRLEPTLVVPVRLRVELLGGVLGLAGRRLVIDELVLEVRDPVQHCPRVDALGIEVHVAAHEGHETPRVGRVVDRERGGEPEPVGLAAQDANTGGVEGRHPHRPRSPTDQRRHAFPHLGRRLVGERDGQDGTRVGAAGGDQPGDPAGEHARLSRSGAGDDQELADRVAHRLALGVVEVIEQRLRPGSALLASGGIAGFRLTAGR
jgi:hypothetical protein